MADISRYFSNLFIRTSYRIYEFYYPALSDRSAIIPLNPGNVKQNFYKNLNIKKSRMDNKMDRHNTDGPLYYPCYYSFDFTCYLILSAVCKPSKQIVFLCCFTFFQIYDPDRIS